MSTYTLMLLFILLLLLFYLPIYIPMSYFQCRSIYLISTKPHIYPPPYISIYLPHSPNIVGKEDSFHSLSVSSFLYTLPHYANLPTYLPTYPPPYSLLYSPKIVGRGDSSHSLSV